MENTTEVTEIQEKENMEEQESIQEENKEEIQEDQIENQEQVQEENQEQEDIPTIPVDADTEFQLKLQQFDKDIATAEAQAADLKKQKIEYIYNTNINSIVSRHKESIMKQQVAAEMQKKLSIADGKNT